MNDEQLTEKCKLLKKALSFLDKKNIDAVEISVESKLLSRKIEENTPKSILKWIYNSNLE